MSLTDKIKSFGPKELILAGSIALASIGIMSCANTVMIPVDRHHSKEIIILHESQPIYGFFHIKPFMPYNTSTTYPAQPQVWQYYKTPKLHLRSDIHKEAGHKYILHSPAQHEQRK